MLRLIPTNDHRAVNADAALATVGIVHEAVDAGKVLDVLDVVADLFRGCVLPVAPERFDDDTRRIVGQCGEQQRRRTERLEFVDETAALIDDPRILTQLRGHVDHSGKEQRLRNEGTVALDLFHDDVSGIEQHRDIETAVVQPVQRRPRRRSRDPTPR